MRKIQEILNEEVKTIIKHKISLQEAVSSSNGFFWREREHLSFIFFKISLGNSLNGEIK
jgi:hypothetical protein